MNYFLFLLFSCGTRNIPAHTYRIHHILLCIFLFVVFPRHIFIRKYFKTSNKCCYQISTSDWYSHCTFKNIRNDLPLSDFDDPYSVLYISPRAIIQTSSESIDAAITYRPICHQQNKYIPTSQTCNMLHSVNEKKYLLWRPIYHDHKLTKSLSPFCCCCCAAACRYIFKYI